VWLEQAWCSPYFCWCSDFALLRILSTRVSALDCLECTSPSPTRLDENRTIAGPFPDHVFAQSLVPAQQRRQHHPRSQRKPPHGCENSMCRLWPCAALPKCLLRLTSNRSTGNANGLFHRLRAPPAAPTGARAWERPARPGPCALPGCACAPRTTGNHL
jgi:hypothetical protein